MIDWSKPVTHEIPTYTTVHGRASEGKYDVRINTYENSRCGLRLTGLKVDIAIRGFKSISAAQTAAHRIAEILPEVLP